MNKPFTVDPRWRFPTAFSHWSVEEFAAMNRVIASERFTMGAEVEAFEHEFALWHRMNHAVMVNSGSSANLIAVAALLEHDIIRSDTIASVPALAWSTTYAPLVQHRLELVLRDCDASWNAPVAPLMPDFIVAVPVLGNPAHLTETADAALRANIPLLVDNCESVGAMTLAGQLAGTQGILNTFSCYWSHQLSAIEGGIILTNDLSLAATCRLLRNHGWTRGLTVPRDFGDEFTFTAMGYNVRPLELHAAIAREQLKKLSTRITARQFNFSLFAEMMRDLPITLPAFAGSISPFGIHFTVESKAKRDALAKALRADGIDCRPPAAGSFRKQPYGARWADQETPNADRIHDCGMFLGNPPFDGTPLMERAVKVIKESLCA